jgi:hypothetical protein
VIEEADTQQQGRDDSADRQDDEAWRERKQQRFHGTPQARSASLLAVEFGTLSRALVVDMTASLEIWI